ncbi:MAG: hypothetical protein EPO16_07320 [Dehalococcoidia bacterium]|nr:MAG: hypothetical protein EPO16_07320 [Dehalococcoidia bacterium]
MTVDRARLHRTLNPTSIAVVGDKGPNYQWLSNCAEFTGDLYSVQLDEKEIPGIEAKGIRNFRGLMEIPGPVDLVICAVPRNVAPFIVADAVKKQVGGVAMFTSGFVETGEPVGIELQAKIVAMASEAAMPLVGPNCMGIYNRQLGVKFMAGQEKGEGGAISIVSQSGTHGIGMTMGSQRVGVPVTRTISIGNAAVLNEADYLEYLLEDPDTPAIAMYLEGIRAGRRFFELLREGTKKKPVIIWRGGRTKSGARAVKSHTASLASDDAIWMSLIRQCGAISTESLEDTVETIAALVHTPPSSRKNLALVAMTGGQSVAITDQFERAGFEVPELSESSYERLGAFFVTIGGSYRNPFDASSTLGRETDNLQKILEILADDPVIEGVAIELQTRDFDKSTEHLDGMLALMAAYRTKTGQPVVALIPAGGGMGGQEEVSTRARFHVAQAGFPVFSSFRAGAQALGRVRAFYEELGARTKD